MNVRRKRRCDFCGKRHGIRKDGSLRVHLLKGGIRCEGSHR